MTFQEIKAHEFQYSIPYHTTVLDRITSENIGYITINKPQIAGPREWANVAIKQTPSAYVLTNITMVHDTSTHVSNKPTKNLKPTINWTTPSTFY